MTGKTHSRYFTVDVGGHRLTKDVWRIDGTLTVRRDVEAADRDQVLSKGRLALVDAIVREGVRGRRFGAISVQVRIDVDGHVSDFELGDVLPGAAPP